VLQDRQGLKKLGLGVALEYNAAKILSGQTNNHLTGLLFRLSGYIKHPLV